MSAPAPRLTCALTFDFDAMSVWIGSMKSNNPSMISRGEFGAVAVPRILDLCRKYGIRASWCVPGHTAYAYPDLVRRVRDEGHEIVHHGWVHENPASFDEAGERRVLERGLEALEKVAGRRPRGYRSPAWDLSPRTASLLLEYGFEYDSSCMGNDFYPYYLRSGDRWSTDDVYVFGEPTRIVELPVTWGLDDFPPFEFVLGSNTGLSAPSAVEEIWRGDFDWAYANCPGGLYDLTLHPQVIGRGHRMLMLERLIRHFQDHDGVVFASLADYAERWRADNPLGEVAA
ncbi:MAG: peptidoglycan-N-acetylglucosamine deacetylase [Candidatus Binatota bacterium]|nr:peptidoglycan-N-acetylglucosamine deacetylase [Candidatus Binatota bacterium]